MKLTLIVGFLLLIGGIWAGEHDFASGLALGILCGIFGMVFQANYHKERERRYRRFFNGGIY